MDKFDSSVKSLFSGLVALTEECKCFWENDEGNSYRTELTILYGQHPTSFKISFGLSLDSCNVPDMIKLCIEETRLDNSVVEDLESDSKIESYVFDRVNHSRNWYLFVVPLIDGVKRSVEICKDRRILGRAALAATIERYGTDG